MESSKKEDTIREKEEEKKKSCSDCKTTKTPLWRSGPSGPKSLCNACGIRYRKKRRSPSIESKREKVEKRRNLKVTLMPVQRSQRQWGEVERAALLLMALSCGAVFA